LLRAPDGQCRNTISTLRDIQHHLVSTIGTELSHEDISKINRPGRAEEVLVWQRRPLGVGDLSPMLWWSRSKTPLMCAQGCHIAVGVAVDGMAAHA
jgi:putative transposase